MAILDGLKNAVAANTARSANHVAVNGLHSLVGNVFGVDLATNPAAKLTNRTTKFTTKSLAYPAGVEVDDQQGHYIIFEILEQDKAKIKAAKDKKIAAQKQVGYDYMNASRSGGGNPNLAPVQPTVGEKNRQQALDDKQSESGIKSLSRGKFGNSNSIQLTKKATTRIATQIALYMPPSLSVSYNSKYGDQEIGVLAATGKTALDAFAGKNGTNFDTALKQGLGEFKMGAETAVMAILDTAAPGATALLALEKGAIRTPKMELMFEGIGRREFSYEFTFIPKDVAEAEIIKNIVYEFKYHMASNYTDGTFREMEIPSFFNIAYMHKGAENTHLNKISTCALEGMDVSYGADRFVAYEDGRPQTTKISLKFKELEIITKSAIAAGA
jgi:hypothetical protein